MKNILLVFITLIFIGGTPTLAKELELNNEKEEVDIVDDMFD